VAARQAGEVDAVPGAGERDLDAAVHQAFGVEPAPDAGLVEKLHRALLEHAGANAAEHMLAAAPFQHDRVDAGALEQLRQQQPGRTRPDDGDLYPHCCPPGGIVARAASWRKTARG
jgi:hypothetical protein